MARPVTLDGTPLRAVLLDWDGTLADSHAPLYAANAAVMRAYQLPFDEATYRRHFAADWRVMYQRLGLRHDQVDEAGRMWEAAYEGITSTTLFPGVEEALRRLEAAGLSLGLVTAGPTLIVGPQVERLGLGELLRVCVFGDDTVEQKPHAGPLRLALQRLDPALDPAHVAFLGDAPDDMRMAQAVGVHGIGVPSGVSDAAALLEAGAETTARSVSEWVSRLLLEPAAAAG